MYPKKEKIYPADVPNHSSNRENKLFFLMIEGRKRMALSCSIKNLNTKIFKDTKILKINQYQKSDKTPFIIYADLECLIEKVDVCEYNHEN